MSELERWLAVMDGMGALTLRIDATTLEVQGASERTQTRLGLSSDAATGGERFWERFIPEQDRSRVLETLREVASDGGSRVVEHGGRTGDGVELSFRTSLVALEPGAGGPTTLLGAMLDITSSRDNERQWREMESWLTALGESLPFDFWICDREGRVMLQNPASVRRIGNVLGRRADDLEIGPHRPGIWTQALERALAGETVREEHEVARDGVQRSFVRVVSPSREGADIRGALAVDFDVTELKQTEDRLRASVSELARTQETLAQKRQLAALGEMAAIVAHEVRNPLGVIANVGSILRNQLRDSVDQTALCAIIGDEVNRLDALVTALLDFIRPSTPALRELALEATIEEVIAQVLHESRGSQGIRVVRRFAPAMPLVRTDAQLFSVVITNVLRNALQAMSPHGDGQLEVVLEREARGSDVFARIAVHDSGPGIPHGFEQRAFEPFLTTRATGTGLGLTIVKRLITELGGEVELNRGAERGTVCVLRLPLG